MPELKPTPGFIACIRVLAALYSEFKLTPETVTAYWIVLGDIDPQLLQAATLQLGSNPETNFFPRAGAIRKACYELAENENETITAADAWIEVMAAMGKYSVYRTPEFDNPLTMKALGGTRGWRALCVSDESDESYHRHQFIKAYESYIERERYNFRMLPQVKALAAQFAGRQLESGAETPQLTEGE